MASEMPVGIVAPFFLTPLQIAGLQPEWLPADGRTVSDDDSQYNGKKLPDLSNSFVLGAPATQDLAPEDPSNSQAQQNLNYNFSYSGRTDKLQDNPNDVCDRQGEVGTNYPPRFVIDTTVNETLSANHTHAFSINATINTALPLPPFARLIYMIKVR